MLSDEIIRLMVKSISPENKKDYDWSTNCFLYGINCSALPSEITYVDDKKIQHYGENLGEASNSYKKIRTKKETEFSFLKDCDVLGIDVKFVTEDYELSDENEWLVSLYYTIPFLYYGEKISDFHFIKKKFAEEVWMHKFPYSNVKSTDMDEKPILYPADFNFYITDDNNQLINYKYINTYCLKRKKDLF